jgi:hypothetical protein
LVKPNQLRNFSRWQKIAAIQDGHLGLNEHAGCSRAAFDGLTSINSTLTIFFGVFLLALIPPAIRFGRHLDAVVGG